MSRPEDVLPWRRVEPGRLIGQGHPAGDFLEAHEWIVVERRLGLLRLDVHLPDRVKSPRGHLFGGFTPTYVDMVALHTVRAGRETSGPWRWLATSNMRVDYFEPVWGPRFAVESQLVTSRGRTHFVETRFLGEGGELLVFALTTLKDIPLETPGT